MKTNDGHDMRSLVYLLNRWGRAIELMRFWHGFPTIESSYRAFFGPGAFSSGKIPIPNLESDIVQINLRILALKKSYSDALLTMYGHCSKETGGYLTDDEKAAMLKVSTVEFKSRVYFAKKQLLSNAREQCDSAKGLAGNVKTAAAHPLLGRSDAMAVSR